jgi:lipopolysaccharide heptosyltransferase II
MKILIIRLSSLGDIVLTQPIVKRLHEVFGEAELHYLVKEQFSDIVQQFGVPLQVLKYNKSLRFHLSLLKTKYDLVFDLHSKFSTFLLKLFCGGASKFTYDKQHVLRKKIVRHKTDKLIDSTLDLYSTALSKAAKMLNFPELEKELEKPVLHLNPVGFEIMRKRIQTQDDRKAIALFPGATHFTKRYPREYFVRMIQMAGEGYRFRLLGSYAEKPLTYRMHADTANRSSDYGGLFSLKELMEVIAISDAVITNDSGPMHIAAALGKPQIAIFGATHPSLGFRPLNDRAVILCKGTRCQPCSLHGGKKCPRKHFACMLSIEPQQVLSELKRII